jgi:hypothetical protein
MKQEDEIGKVVWSAAHTKDTRARRHLKEIVELEVSKWNGPGTIRTYLGH